MLIATILEMVGLGFIFSIVGSVSSMDSSNLFVEKLSVFFGLNQIEILSYLLLAFIFFYIFKIIFLTFYNWFESNFLYSYKEYLSSKVFRGYLNQNYSYFYKRDSSEFTRNLITEVNQYIIYLVAILKTALETVVLIGIFCLLAYVSSYLIIIVVFYDFVNLNLNTSTNRT